MVKPVKVSKEVAEAITYVKSQGYGMEVVGW